MTNTPDTPDTPETPDTSDTPNTPETSDMADGSDAQATSSPVLPARPRWQRLLCLKPRNGRYFKYAPTMWGWIWLVVIFGGGGMLGFAEYSMEPDFCRSCHLMEPYYVAWHKSSHKNVRCVDCHFKPGLENTLIGKWEASSQAIKYITGTYGSKPHAEVHDVSCLRSGCHERRILEGKVKWPIKNQRGHKMTINFDHTPHLSKLRRGKKLRCVSCHSQIVQGKHLVVTLDSCFICHFKGVKHGRDDQTLGGCRSCHSEPKQEIKLPTGMFKHSQYIKQGAKCQDCHADVIRGDGNVPKQVCWNCHNRTEDVVRYSDVSFVHKTHVTEHKVECTGCHTQISHHLTAALPTSGLLNEKTGVLSNSGDCGQCHENTHQGALAIFQGRGGRGVPEMPSRMYMAQVDCIACHRHPKNSPQVASVTGQIYTATQASCNRCHGTHYEGRLDEWKTAIADLQGRADLYLRKAKRLLDNVQLSETRELELHRLLGDAEHNINFIRHGMGVHNVPYATALLNFAIEHCQQIIKAIQQNNPNKKTRKP